MNKNQSPGTLVKFSKGFFCPFNSVGFIRRHRCLYKFVLLPFLINIITFILVVYFGFGFFQEAVMARLPQGDAWYWLILHYFLVMAAVVVILVLVFFTFTVVGSLIASPFNDLLSERTEKMLTGIEDSKPFSWRQFWQDAWRTLNNEGKKIAVFLVGMLVLLLLHLLPVFGTALYSVLSVCWAACFLVLEYNGYVFDRKRLRFAEQRRIIFRHAALMSGFGLGMFCVLAIPFLQFFCIPLGVVGAVRVLHWAGELLET